MAWGPIGGWLLWLQAWGLSQDFGCTESWIWMDRWVFRNWLFPSGFFPFSKFVFLMSVFSYIDMWSFISWNAQNVKHLNFKLKLTNPFPQLWHVVTIWRKYSWYLKWTAIGIAGSRTPNLPLVNVNVIPLGLCRSLSSFFMDQSPHSAILCANAVAFNRHGNRREFTTVWLLQTI